MAKALSGPNSSEEDGQTKEPELDTTFGDFRELRRPSVQPEIGWDIFRPYLALGNAWVDLVEDQPSML
jgi:hypothetical protein